LHDVRQNTGTNFIGFTWGYNGCRRFFKHFNWEANPNNIKRPCECFSGDISGKDQSAQWGELLMYIAQCYIVVNWDVMTSNHRKLIQTLILFLAQHTASHIVRWYGACFRYVIGCLFSGDFNTSDFNTFHMSVLWFSYLLHNLPREMWSVALKDPDLNFGAQGDDCVGKIPREYQGWISGEGFFKYIGERHRQYLKPGSFVSSDSFLTKVNRGTGQIIGGSKIKFLQRYFILNEGSGWPEPFRPTFVVISKLFGVTKVSTPGLFCSKCIGLAYDTMGTNPHCYELLSIAFQAVARTYDLTFNEIKQSIAESTESLFRSSTYKWGIKVSADTYHDFPSLHRIYTLFNADHENPDIAKELSRDKKFYYELAPLSR